MNLFINDIPLNVLKPGNKPDTELFNHVIDASVEDIVPARLNQSVLIEQVSIEDIDRIIDYIRTHAINKLDQLVITVADYKLMKAHIKSKFKIIKAAGGVVRKGDKILMIYRLKKWDLPKGKLDNGEKPKEGAIREVEEECGVKVKLGKKICTTWHTYTMNKRSILKKTSWYIMDLKSDEHMKPQIEEDIEEVRWMGPKDVYHALKDSYQSINYVFQRYDMMQNANVDKESA